MISLEYISRIRIAGPNGNILRFTILFLKVAAPFYIPNNGVWGFQFFPLVLEDVFNGCRSLGSVLILEPLKIFHCLLHYVISDEQYATILILHSSIKCIFFLSAFKDFSLSLVCGSLFMKGLDVVFKFVVRGVCWAVFCFLLKAQIILGNK